MTAAKCHQAKDPVCSRWAGVADAMRGTGGARQETRVTATALGDGHRACACERPGRPAHSRRPPPPYAPVSWDSLEVTAAKQTFRSVRNIRPPNRAR